MIWYIWSLLAYISMVLRLVLIPFAFLTQTFDLRSNLAIPILVHNNTLSWLALDLGFFNLTFNFELICYEWFY